MSFEDKNVVASNLDSWGCPYEAFFKDKYKDKKDYQGKSFTFVDSKGKDTSDNYTGLCCSGFISWAIHNGMFDIGNVYTSIFAKTYVENNGVSEVIGRNYQFKDKLYASPKINENVDVYEKLKGIKESDILSLDKVEKTNKVGMKAGDLLWYSGTCQCKGEQKCPEECICNSGGHFAMILGIYKKNGEISTIYVGEASDAGNRLTAFYLDKAPYFKDWNVTSSCKEIKLIRMDNVYNYYTDKGNTWNYTDNWF